MGRYTGPVEKLSRREGVELFLKGERALNGKSALERRGDNPPGQHGATRRRKPSIYSTQLRAKQTAKRYYGVRERQFRRYVDKANRAQGVTGEELLRLLERRLDNVVYRLGFAGTRAQARQFVNHGHVLVNGKKVDIASYLVTPGEAVKITDSVREIASSGDGAHGLGRELAADGLRRRSRARCCGSRSASTSTRPVNEQLIVELYSRL